MKRQRLGTYSEPDLVQYFELPDLRRLAAAERMGRVMQICDPRLEQPDDRRRLSDMQDDESD